MTPVEHERLRQYSYKRQLAAGMMNPGRAGLTADRFGDADEWVPKDESKYETAQELAENTTSYEGAAGVCGEYQRVSN